MDSIEKSIDKIASAVETNSRCINDLKMQVSTHVVFCKTTHCHLETIPEAIRRLEQSFNRALNGNGGVGINTRLDRIEQVEKGRKWTIRTLATTVIGIAAVAVFDFFSKHK